MIIVITITIFLLFWTGPRPGDDTPPGAGQAGPDTEHHNTHHAPAAEQLRTGSHDIHTIDEDDMQAEGPAGGEELVVDTEYNMYMDEEETTTDTGTSTEVEHECSFNPAGREAVGVSDVDDRDDRALGERPPGTGRWARVLARVTWTPRHWTCDPAACRRCATAKARRIERNQDHLLDRM